MNLDTVVNTQHGHHPVPPPPPRPMPTKNVVLTHKFGRTVYALAVRTTTDAVFDSKYRYSLTEMLSDIADSLTSNFKKTAQLSEAFETLMKDCPEEFNTLKEIADYINVNGDPKSELISLIDTKVDKEEGKGLSTNDFTDILKAKLESDYTKEEIDRMFTDQAAIMQSIVDTVESYNTAVNGRIDAVENRIDAVDTRIDGVVTEADLLKERVVDLENLNNIVVNTDGSGVKDNDIWMKLETAYAPSEEG